VNNRFGGVVIFDISDNRIKNLYDNSVETLKKNITFPPCCLCELEKSEVFFDGDVDYKPSSSSSSSSSFSLEPFTFRTHYLRLLIPHDIDDISKKTETNNFCCGVLVENKEILQIKMSDDGLQVLILQKEKVPKKKICVCTLCVGIC
jgi:hypothetical protein